MQCHSGATALHSPWNMLRVGEQVMKNPALLGCSAHRLNLIQARSWTLFEPGGCRFHTTGMHQTGPLRQTEVSDFL